MLEQKLSRKALKTKKQIKIALAQLLQNKELKDITVQEVAQKADISRTTFYNYFYDVYDIYEQLEKEVLAELGLLTLNFHDDPSEDFGGELFDYIMQNPEIFKMIFSPYNTGELRAKIANMIEGVFRLIQTEKNSVAINDREFDYYSAFWSSGCIAVIEKCHRNPFDHGNDLFLIPEIQINVKENDDRRKQKAKQLHAAVFLFYGCISVHFNAFKPPSQHAGMLRLCRLSGCRNAAASLMPAVRASERRSCCGRKNILRCIRFRQKRRPDWREDSACRHPAAPGFPH